MCQDVLCLCVSRPRDHPRRKVDVKLVLEWRKNNWKQQISQLTQFIELRLKTYLCRLLKPVLRPADVILRNVYPIARARCRYIII